MVLNVLYILILTTTLKTAILVPFHNRRKQVRLERLSHLPKVTQLVKEQMGSSRAPASRFTARVRKGKIWDQSQEEGGAARQPRAIYMTPLQPCHDCWHRWLLCCCQSLEGRNPGQHLEPAAGGYHWSAGVGTFYLKLQVK